MLWSCGYEAKLKCAELALGTAASAAPGLIVAAWLPASHGFSVAASPPPQGVCHAVVQRRNLALPVILVMPQPGVWHTVPQCRNLASGLSKARLVATVGNGRITVTLTFILCHRCQPRSRSTARILPNPATGRTPGGSTGPWGQPGGVNPSWH